MIMIICNLFLSLAQLYPSLGLQFVCIFFGSLDSTPGVSQTILVRLVCITQLHLLHKQIIDNIILSILIQKIKPKIITCFDFQSGTDSLGTLVCLCVYLCIYLLSVCSPFSKQSTKPLLRPVCRQVLISCTVQTAGQVQYKCTEAGMNSRITVPSKVCASRVSTTTL